MRIALVLFFCALMPWTAQAMAQDGKSAAFSELERRIIEHYFGQKALTPEEAEARHYRLYDDFGDADVGRGKGKGKGKHKGLPPGLAKRESLPPGLARKAQLPPGLAKRALPRGLEAELPPLPAGVERVIVNDDVVLIEAATGLVLDVLYGVAER